MSDYIDARLSVPEKYEHNWINVTDQNGRLVERMTPGRADALGDHLKSLAREAWGR